MMVVGQNTHFLGTVISCCEPPVRDILTTKQLHIVFLNDLNQQLYLIRNEPDSLEYSTVKEVLVLVILGLFASPVRNTTNEIRNSIFYADMI